MFLYVWQGKDLASSEFASVAAKGLTDAFFGVFGAFFGCVAGKGVSTLHLKEVGVGARERLQGRKRLGGERHGLWWHGIELLSSKIDRSYRISISPRPRRRCLRLRAAVIREFRCLS